MKLLLFPGPYGNSHSTRLLQLGVQLHSLGCEIAVSLSQKQKELPWDKGFTFFDLPDFPEVKNIEESIYNLADEGLIDEYVSAEVKAIRDFQPDFVIADLRLTAAISARLEEIPLISVQNASLTEDFNPYHFFDLEISDRLQKKYRPLRAHLAFKKVAKKRGLKSLKTVFDFINGDYNWIVDLVSLFPIENPSKPVFFIGPLIFEDSATNTSIVPDFFYEKDKISIYITIGNSKKTDLIPIFIEAFSSHKYCNVLITTGYNQPSSLQGAVASNIFVTPYINGAEILPHADIMIHHGGTGSMYQALKYKIPTIVLPFNIEQKINAMAIEKSETGVVMDWKALSPERLFKKTSQVYQYRKILKSNAAPFGDEVNSPIAASLLLDKLKSYFGIEQAMD